MMDLAGIEPAGSAWASTAACLTGASWNRLASWFNRIEALRAAA
jgi:hypothetical protein